MFVENPFFQKSTFIAEEIQTYDILIIEKMQNGKCKRLISHFKQSSETTVLLHK